MRGDFTRDTRARALRDGTRSVLLQQGRQLLDADWNEQAGLSAHRHEQAVRAVIGQQGAPRDEAGFAVQGITGGIAVGAGVLFVDGVRIENPRDATYAEQAAAAALPALTTALADGAEGLAYLEIVETSVGVAADASYGEPGLGGGDTVVREQVRWALRVAPMAGIGLPADQIAYRVSNNLSMDLPLWRGTTGGLDADVQTEAESSDPGPCEMPPSAGYLDQLNRLFHVEIHAPGSPGTAMFKYSDDGRIETGLRADGSNFVIDLPLARAREWFPKDAIVELITPEHQAAGVAGPIGKISSEPGDALVIDGILTSALSPRAVLRRWNAPPQNLPAAGTWAALSRGVKIRFSSGHYAVGAGWTIPARTLTGDIIWPPYRPADKTVSGIGYFAPMTGRRRFAALARVRRSGASFSVEQDLRQIFPPLIDLDARFIKFDDSVAVLGASNVQTAIEALAARPFGEDCHSYVVRPGAGWDDVFGKIPDGVNATICFAVGNYPLNAPVVIANKGHIRLIGNGVGTKIWCMGDLTALSFADCKSVELSDVMVAADRQAPVKLNDVGNRIRGAVDILNCGQVRVTRCTLMGAGRYLRQSSCLRIGGALDGGGKGTGTITVDDCDFVAGDLASGLMILNADTAHITNNRFRPRFEDGNRVWHRWIQDRAMKAYMGRILFNTPTDDVKPGRPINRTDENLYQERTIAPERADKSTIFYGSNIVGGVAWRNFAIALSANTIRAEKLRLAIRDKVGALWMNGGNMTVNGKSVNGFAGAFAKIRGSATATMDCAILFAGGRANRILISGNSITGAFNGIKAALSDGSFGNANSIGSIHVLHNYVRLRIAAVDRVRHGIFVGNAARCWITDNDVALESAEDGADKVRLDAAILNSFHKVHGEGIRVFGHLGPMIIVRQNVVRDMATAFTVVPSRSAPTGQRQWQVRENLALNAAQAFKLDNACRNIDNATG